mmetsp:Transcript_24260/g.76325  ORF Transcript_24260/g.76325 Transcript_24260/m.76325 type:complete len:163 (-) Transcript_24260:2315-2803(-)
MAYRPRSENNKIPPPEIAMLGPVEIQGLFTSHLASKPQMRPVWEHLVSNVDYGIQIRPAAKLSEENKKATFAQLSERAYSEGELVIGYRMDGRIYVNPPRKDQVLDLSRAGDGIVYLSRVHDMYDNPDVPAMDEEALAELEWLELVAEREAEVEQLRLTHRR